MRDNVIALQLVEVIRIGMIVKLIFSTFALGFLTINIILPNHLYLILKILYEYIKTIICHKYMNILG